MTTIREVLIRRDGLTPEEADARVEEARAAAAELIDEGCSLDDLEEIIQEHFGIEPDYVMELID